MNEKKDNWIVGTILKCIFIPIGLALVLFVLATVIAVSLKLMNITVPAIIERGIIPIVQLFFPILILLFGWLVILLIDLSKHKK